MPTTVTTIPTDIGDLERTDNEDLEDCPGGCDRDLTYGHVHVLTTKCSRSHWTIETLQTHGVTGWVRMFWPAEVKASWIAEMAFGIGDALVEAARMAADPHLRQRPRSPKALPGRSQTRQRRCVRGCTASLPHAECGQTVWSSYVTQRYHQVLAQWPNEGPGVVILDTHVGVTTNELGGFEDTYQTEQLTPAQARVLGETINHHAEIALAVSAVSP